MKKQGSAINDLLRIMARLRSPTGCPWDREQDHQTLRWHAVEEVYELLDAIEAGDDHEMMGGFGDLFFQGVFQSQMGEERKTFQFYQLRWATDGQPRNYCWERFGSRKSVCANRNRIKLPFDLRQKSAQVILMRNLIKHVLASDNPTEGLTVKGWVRTRRDSKGFSFLELNDGSC